MFKRISIILLILFTLLSFTIGAGAVAAGLFVEKDAGNTYINYVDAAGTSIMKIDDTDGVTIATAVTANTYTSMTITSTADASSLTVGSIVTPGGIACAKQLFIGDDIDMSVSGTGVYDITLKDTVNDALSIVGGSTDMMVFDTDTDAILIVPPLTVTGVITSNGGITVGASGAGFDVTFYGDEATADFFWDQNGDTYGALTLGADTKGVDFKAFGTTTGNYLIWDRSADDLLLVGTASQLGVAGTTASTSSTTGSIHTAGGLGVAGAAFIAGVVEVGADAAGTDFTVYGDVTTYKAWWDANGDTNGAWYFGADTKGVLVSLYGDTTGCGVFWNPSTDTSGTFAFGASGGAKGVDVAFYGHTNGSYLLWDRSVDDLLVVGSGIVLSGTSVDGITIGGTITDEAIQIGGTYDHGIRFTEDPVAGDVTNSFINVGDYTTGIAVAPTTANMFGVVHNVTMSVNVAYWYQAYYTKITTSGTTTSTSIAGHALRMNVATSLEAAYGIQCHTNITAGADVTQEVISVSTVVDLGTGETTTDRAVALQAMITGSGTAGTVVGDAIVGYFVNAGTVVTTDDVIKVYNQSAATVADGIEIENDGTMTVALKINNDGTCTTGVLFEGAHAIGIDMNGTYTTAAISMDGATFAAGDNEIEMRNNVAGDKTIIASGAATDDAGIVTAVGADADIADGSLYMSCTDSGGVLFIKKNDIWTAFTNP